MAVVVGFAADERGTEALHLGCLLARSLHDELVVCAVLQTAWPPSPERIDTEYVAYAQQRAEAALAQARDALPSGLGATFLTAHARSVPSGLLETADRHGASLVVLGSSASGLLGRVSLGSVTDRLLHSSHLPVAVAPRGFRCSQDARVERFTVAFGGSGGPDLVVAAGAVAARVGAALRVASFAVRPPTVFGGSVETDVEDLVTDRWAANTTAAIERSIEAVRSLPDVPQPLHSAIGTGHDWGAALAAVPWGPGEVLVIGSSSAGPVARVFLGSHAVKIVRNCPVPVVAVPRDTTAAFVDRLLPA